jgi:hypothetical protein
MSACIRVGKTTSENIWSEWGNYYVLSVAYMCHRSYSNRGKKCLMDKIKQGKMW